MNGALLLFGNALLNHLIVMVPSLRQDTREPIHARPTPASGDEEIVEGVSVNSSLSAIAQFYLRADEDDSM